MNTFHDQSDALREAMVAELRGMGGIRSEAVATAFRAVPRHLFAPDAPVESVYAANATAWSKYDDAGRMTSTVSAAYIQAVQLEQAQVRPGMRVLEIGSGGYNAALLAAMVGETGEVTTADIDPEIVNRARACLDVAGYRQVRTVVADGATAVPEHGPYDRIVVTVRSWDIPADWVEQLAPDGQLVVPLQFRGLTRTVALDRDPRSGMWLSGGDTRLCAFVPMQGAGAHEDQIAFLPETVTGGEEGPGRVQLRSDAFTRDELAVMAAGIGDAIKQGGDPVTVWTGVEFDHVDDLDLWLSLHLPAAVVLTADREITDTGRPTSITRAGAPALVSSGGFAYRTKRPVPGTDTFETGVLAWGSDRDELAAQYAEAITGWGRFRSAGGTGPRLEIHAAGSEIPAPAAVELSPRHRVVEKTHTRIVFSWPDPSDPRELT